MKYDKQDCAQNGANLISVIEMIRAIYLCLNLLILIKAWTCSGFLIEIFYQMIKTNKDGHQIAASTIFVGPVAQSV